MADKFDDLQFGGRAPSWWSLGFGGGLPRGPRIAVFVSFAMIFWVILGPAFAVLGASLIMLVADTVCIHRERRKSGTV